MEQLLSKAAVDVLAERQRQIKVEGCTPECDDAHTEGQLAKAASCYAFAAVVSEKIDQPYKSGRNLGMKVKTASWR